jgi:SOS-response transcriptional repressor LexA
MNSQNVEKLPPVPHFQKHELFATCPGDAMAPRLCRGYLLALRKMADDATIINGEIYVVDTKSSGMFLRRLVDNGTSLTFIAENQQEFPDFDLDYSDVINIFRVVGVLITNL